MKGSKGIGPTILKSEKGLLSLSTLFERPVHVSLALLFYALDAILIL